MSASVEAPLLPDAAKARTAKGAAAFVPYWFATLDYALTTGDVDPLRSASAQSCAPCTAAQEKISQVYGDGGVITGAAYVVRSVKAASFLTLDRPILRVVID